MPMSQNYTFENRKKKKKKKMSLPPINVNGDERRVKEDHIRMIYYDMLVLLF